MDPAGPQKSASELIERVGTDDKLSGLKLNSRDQNLTKIDIGCDASSSEGPIGAWRAPMGPQRAPGIVKNILFCY